MVNLSRESVRRTQTNDRKNKAFIFPRLLHLVYRESYSLWKQLPISDVFFLRHHREAMDIINKLRCFFGFHGPMETFWVKKCKKCLVVPGQKFVFVGECTRPNCGKVVRI